ncbi:MAG: 2-amino-4-hydroxy-6-hydroxymethyldihydropteridine diphosphokinase [Lautropia sp.]|nr:2-amino-4-hydroxy-6-hydroxymethyldihydropteridine diphosphokinase [Lautropia sp.]
MSTTPDQGCTQTISPVPQNNKIMPYTPQPLPIRRAWIGLGSNLPGSEGSPAEALKTACAHLDSLPDTRVTACSRLYRSAPFQAEGPDFFNQVVRLETRLPATALLTALQVIEHRFGRERPYRNAPRTLDLDLLVLEGETSTSNLLTLPHPRLHERLFVLMPLAELNPDLQIPGQPGNAASLLAALQDSAADQQCEPVAA